MFLCQCFGSDWYLFQLTVLLKPEFFALCWFDKVTTGRYTFVSVTENVSVPIELTITQVDAHVKMWLISRLINGISRVSKNYSSILMVQLFQYLLRYHH